MATYVKGDEVTKTTDGTAVTADVNYELFEKNSDGTYTSLATGETINFEVSALGLAVGDHILVVQAQAEGYESSDYSNEEVYEIGLLAKTIEEIQNSLYVHTAKDVNTTEKAVTTVSESEVSFTGDKTTRCLYSDVPLYAGSEVEIKVEVPEAGGNFCIGFDDDVSNWLEKNWKTNGTSIIIPASHIWTTDGTVQYLERQTNGFKTAAPAMTLDLTAKMTLKVLEKGFEIWQNDALAYTVTQEDSNPYMVHSAVPVYFCFTTATSVNIAISGIKVIG